MVPRRLTRADVADPPRSDNRHRVAGSRGAITLSTSRVYNERHVKIAHVEHTAVRAQTEGCSMHYILFYDVVEDFVAKREPFRVGHLELARRAHQRGELVLAGALADPVDGAVLVFRGSSPEVAESFARSDGYVGALLLQRDAAESVEVLVITWWRSLEAIRRFAGADLERAVVADEARAVLTQFDRRVRHYEVVVEDAPKNLPPKL